MQEVNFSDWQKLDLRAGKIIKVEDIPDADKLYKLEVDLGSEKRAVCAGIKQYYKKEELKGKRCVIFCNLEPKKLKGIESRGMILAADDEKGDIVLIAPEKDIKLGSRIK